MDHGGAVRGEIEPEVAAEAVDAPQALALGWLQALVPRERLDEEAASLAARIAHLPAAGIAAVKSIGAVGLTEAGSVDISPV